MSDKPKDQGDDSEAARPDVEADGGEATSASQRDEDAFAPEQPVDAEWSEPAADDLPQSEAPDDIERPDLVEAVDVEPIQSEAPDDTERPETVAEDETKDTGDIASAAAAAMAMGAAATAAGGGGDSGGRGAAPEREPAPEPEKRSGGRLSLAYVWLLLLTLGFGYLFYTLVADVSVLRDRMEVAEAPGIKSGIAAGAAAARQAEANAAEIAALQKKLAEGGGDAGRTEALESETANLKAALEDLRAKVDELAARPAPSGGAPADLAPVNAAREALAADLRGRIDALDAAIADADKRLAALEDRASKHTVRRLAGAILALNDLRDALETGKPFAQLLERARVALPDAAPLKDAPWTAYAEEGLPQEAELLDRIQAISVAIGQDRLKARLESGESWVDRAVGGVVDRLKVRRVGAGVEGTEPAAVAARAEAAMQEGDVAKAVAEVEALQGEDAARFADWLAAAKANLAAENDLDAVEQAAIAAADGA